MEKITKIGNTLTKIITTVLAAVFLIYGLLMLWDMYRTEIRAFASYDLLKYRPNVENEEPPYLDDLIEINSDTRGWITIYNTNIDYPIMQGKDDWEYLNKDVYGEFSIAGSIYMSCKYKGDFSEPYTLIYGHHLANGSMFGDLDKFKDRAFFDANQKGILIMTDKAFDLTVMAVLETTAYDPDIYSTYTGECLDRALYKREAAGDRVIALSTCDEKSEFSRTVLLCKVGAERQIPSRESGGGTQRKEAVGHPMAGAYWSLLNLVILAVTIYAATKARICNKRTLVIVMLAIVSILIFVLTEDLHKPIQVVDIWTPFMLAILWGVLVINHGKEN